MSLSFGFLSDVRSNSSFRSGLGEIWSSPPSNVETKSLRLPVVVPFRSSPSSKISAQDVLELDVTASLDKLQEIAKQAYDIHGEDRRPWSITQVSTVSFGHGQANLPTGGCTGYIHVGALEEVT